MMNMMFGAGLIVAAAVGGFDHQPNALLNIASPADSFVVHDAPPAPPTDAPAADSPAAAPNEGLDAAIERLRGAAVARPDATPATTPGPATTAPASPAPTPTAPVAPPPAWTNVTSQGVRWRMVRNSAAPSLVIDMGAGRTATVQVDPAFGALKPDAANDRIDYLKQTILETFPPGTSSVRFARDGSVVRAQ